MDECANCKLFGHCMNKDERDLKIRCQSYHRERREQVEKLQKLFFDLVAYVKAHMQ